MTLWRSRRGVKRMLFLGVYQFVTEIHWIFGKIHRNWTSLGMFLYFPTLLHFLSDIGINLFSTTPLHYQIFIIKSIMSSFMGRNQIQKKYWRNLSCLQIIGEKSQTTLKLLISRNYTFNLFYCADLKMLCIVLIFSVGHTFLNNISIHGSYVMLI